MKTENIEKIERLLKSANEIRNGLDSYERWQRNPKQYDKIRLGFSTSNPGGPGVNICDTVRLVNYMGTYGNSGVSPFISNIANEDLAQYFFRAIGPQTESILLKMAELIEADAAYHRQQAQSEVDAIQEALTTLKGGDFS